MVQPRNSCKESGYRIAGDSAIRRRRAWSTAGMSVGDCARTGIATKATAAAIVAALTAFTVAPPAFADDVLVARSLLDASSSPAIHEAGSEEGSMPDPVRDAADGSKDDPSSDSTGVASPKPGSDAGAASGAVEAADAADAASSGSADGAGENSGPADSAVASSDNAAAEVEALSLTVEAYATTDVETDAVDAQGATLYDRIQEELAASASAVVAVEVGDSLDSQVSIPAGKQLTIDLNGCSLSATASGAAFQLGGGSTLTVIDNSSGKSGSLSASSALAMQGDYDLEKCNLNLQSGHVSCTTLVDSANCMQVTLRGGSASMTSTMRVGSNVWVDIQGSCSVSSSASGSAFQIANGGYVKVLGNARLTYSGAGSVFVLGRGGVLEMGSGASCGVAISAPSGGIVQFDSNSVDASCNGASISCGSGHPVFKAGSGGAGATIKFVSGVLPDDSMKHFLGSGSYCVHEPGKGFVVRDQAFINGSCIGTADDVYYYSEADFANASGSKVRFLLVEFSFDPTSCAGTPVVGKTSHIHVAPGTELRNAPLFALMEAPAKDGCKFKWVRSSTGEKMTPDEVLALPIAAGGTYSFVGTYVADEVTPPDPGPGPDEPDPVDPPDPGPGTDDPGPVGPDDPAPGGGSGAGGSAGSAGGAGAEAGGAGASGGGAYGAVSAAPGSRGPLEPHAPETPWNPPGLALAAGFTVPSAGPGVVVRELMSAPSGTPAAGAGAGPGGSGANAGRPLFGAQGPAGVDLPLSAPEVALLAGLGTATALAALLASRRAAFLAANAAAASA